jgi:pilus assembly protein Flp/PilA
MLKKIRNTMVALRDDESGAALVEYSILIGLIAAAVIASIVLVSGWVQAAWSVLVTNLGPNPT